MWGEEVRARRRRKDLKGSGADLSSTEGDDYSSEITAQTLARCPRLGVGVQLITYRKKKLMERFDDIGGSSSMDDTTLRFVLFCILSRVVAHVVAHELWYK